MEHSEILTVSPDSHRRLACGEEEVIIIAGASHPLLRGGHRAVAALLK
jgi:hypothetical protein